MDLSAGGMMDFSAGSMLASMLVSTAGFSVFLYGKRQTRAPQMLGGAAMMVAPYAAGGAVGILSAGALLGLGVWLAVRVGL